MRLGLTPWHRPLTIQLCLVVSCPSYSAVAETCCSHFFLQMSFHVFFLCSCCGGGVHYYSCLTILSSVTINMTCPSQSHFILVSWSSTSSWSSGTLVCKAADTRSRNRSSRNRRHKFDARLRRQFFVPMHDF